MKLSEDNYSVDKFHVKTILTLAFIFFLMSSNAQSNIEQLKKSLNYASKIDLSDTLYKISNNFIAKDNSDSVIKYATIGLNLAKITDDKFNIARFKYSLSIAYEIDNKINISLALLLESKKYFETDIQHVSYLAKVYKQMGNLYKTLSKYDIALDYYQKGLIISKKLNDSLNIASIYNNIGTLYFEMNDKDLLALNYFNYALDILTKLKKQDAVVRTINNIAVFYLKNDRYESSLKYLKLALTIFNDGTNPHITNGIYLNMGFAYKKLGQYNKALYYLLKTLELNKKPNDKFLEMNLLINIENVYIKLKKYDKALEYLKKSKIILDELHNIKLLKTYYYEMSVYNSETRNYKSALDYYKKYVETKDSIFNSESKNKIAVLKVSFETLEKEKEIEILKQNNEIQKLAIQKQTLLRNTFIVASVLFILLVLYILIRFYLTRRVNRILSKKNEQIIIQKNLLEEEYRIKDKIFAVIIHDLKNPFSTIVTLINFVNSNYFTMEENQKYSGILSLGKSISNVNELLENLIDWFNIKENKLELDKTEFDISSAVISVVDLYLPQAENKKIEIKTNIPGNLKVFADERMIKTVLRNLIDNSLKFTFDNGKIDIKIIEVNDKVIVSISDNGIGINDGDKEKLFNIDSHFSTKGTDYEKGNGLGLILSKEFVEKNGGQIWFESNVDLGSTFYFSIDKNTENE